MRVLFVCSGGMSSAIVVEALKKEAAKHGLELYVKAIGSNEVQLELEKGWDICMVAPQIRHRFDQIKNQSEEAGIPCAPIPPQAYTPLGGPLLYKALKEAIDK